MEAKVKFSTEEILALMEKEAGYKFNTPRGKRWVGKYSMSYGTGEVVLEDEQEQEDKPESKEE